MSETWRGSGGWVVLLALGLFNAAQGLYLAAAGGSAVGGSVEHLIGVPWQVLQETVPQVAGYINDLLMIVGLFLAAFGVLVAITAATGYRRGHRWAWYSMWVVPAFYLATAIILYARGEIYFSDDLSSELFAFLLVLSLAVQGLEARGFMERRDPGQTALTQ